MAVAAVVVVVLVVSSSSGSLAAVSVSGFSFIFGRTSTSNMLGVVAYEVSCIFFVLVAKQIVFYGFSLCNGW